MSTFCGLKRRSFKKRYFGGLKKYAINLIGNPVMFDLQD